MTRATPPGKTAQPAVAPPLVVHVIHRLAIGGLENGLVNLINRTPPDRYRHAIIAMTDITDFRERIQTPGVVCIGLEKKPGKDLGVFVRLWRALRILRPDILHTRNLSAIEAQVPAFFAGVRHRLHGEHGWDVADLHGRNRKFIWLRRLLAPLIQRWVALSEHGRDYLTDTVGIGRRRIRHICNGVDVERFRPGRDGRHLLPEGFTADANLVFGTVGRLEVVKDQMTLLLAFERLLRDHPEWRERARLVLVGDGSQRDKLARTVTQAAIDDLVWFAGARDDIPELLGGFDVFVLPSLAEGISNTILEAMACGLPVVATRVGGNPDLVVDGETGRLVPAADPAALAGALGEFLADKELAARQSAAARQRAETEFSLQGMADNYLALYDELLGRT